MSAEKGFWSHVKDGLYLGLLSSPSHLPGRRAFGQAFDPTTDRGLVQSLYADLALDADNVSVLLVTPTQNGLNVQDVTQEIYTEVNAYLKDRGDDELSSPPSPAVMPMEFLTHVALWTDGEFGSLLDYAAPNEEARMHKAAEGFMNAYGDIPSNIGLTGAILLLVRDKTGWSARDLGTAPAPRSSAPELDEGPNGAV